MRKGIDVSYHQGKIDFKAVKSAGYDFVIIRAGYGLRTTDTKFHENIKAAIEAGLHIGVYWFMYCLSIEQAVQNAKSFIQAIEPYKDKIDMKTWADYEYDSDTYAKKKGLTFGKKERTDMVNAFMETMEAAGYEVGAYTNQDYMKNKFNDFSNVPLWYARYTTQKDNTVCYMWQYSSKGKVPGINGNVDMNYCYDNVVVYFQRYTGITVSIATALRSIGVDSSYAYRKKIAQANNITGYSGTAKQNLLMLSLLKQGKLIKP